MDNTGNKLIILRSETLSGFDYLGKGMLIEVVGKYFFSIQELIMCKIYMSINGLHNFRILAEILSVPKEFVFIFCKIS